MLTISIHPLPLVDLKGGRVNSFIIEESNVYLVN